MRWTGTDSLTYLLMLLAASGVIFAWADPISGMLCYTLALALASVWFWISGVQRQRIRWHWMATSLIACAGWGLLQSLTGITVYTFATLMDSAAWLTAAGVFLVGLNCFGNARRIELLSRSVLWFGGLLSVLTVLCWHTASNTILWVIPTAYTAENAGTFLNRDQYAVLMEILLPVALARCIQGGRVVAPNCLAAAAMYASVLVTASRAGTALVTIELLIFLVVLSRSVERGLVAASALAGCVLAVTGVFGSDYVVQRFQADDLFTFRREMLLSTWQMIQENWITGFGLGTWPTVYPAFAVFDPPGFFMNHAHNDWAEWTAEGGVLFTAAIGAIAAGSAWISRASLWSIGVPVAFIHATVDFPFHKPALVIVAFLILSASVAAQSPTAEVSSSYCK